MKKITFLVVLIISLFIIKNLVFSIYNLWQKQDLVASIRRELEEEKKKNQVLKSQISSAKSPQFVEEQARNKLFLVKPGESQIVLPKDVLKGKDDQLNRQKNIPNWEKWFRLFFGQL